MRKSLPVDGKDWEGLDAVMTDMARDDIDWRRGRTPLFVFHAGDEVYDVARRAYMKFFSENALGAKRAFFGIQRMEQDIIEMALSLFQAPADACGNLTLGGSESIFMAVKACRDRSRAMRGRINAPNIVVPNTAHPAFDKAGSAMDIEIRRVPVADDFRADVDAMSAAIDDATLMLVGSAPCFPYGVIDPIPALGRLADEKALWLHVDACVGGYTTPFLKQAGHDLPDFDFSVPGVCSLSADLHKFGFCPKPISTLFCRDPDMFAHQQFDFDVWPNGRFVTPTISGTRPGGAIAAAWAVMNHLGADGYRKIAERLVTMRQAYANGIESIDGLQVFGKPDLSILSFGAKTFDMFTVAEHMESRGWLPGLLQQPRGLHLMMSLVHEPVREEYLGHLTESVAAAKVSCGQPSNRSAEY